MVLKEDGGKRYISYCTFSLATTPFSKKDIYTITGEKHGHIQTQMSSWFFLFGFTGCSPVLWLK